MYAIRSYYVAHNRERVISGIEAVKALEAVRENPDDAAAKATLAAHQPDLGFGLLLRKYVTSMDQVTPELIDQAAADTIPRVTPLFWGFRAMVALGFMFLALFGLATWYSVSYNFV